MLCTDSCVRMSLCLRACCAAEDITLRMSKREIEFPDQEIQEANPLAGQEQWGTMVGDEMDT